MNIGTLDSLMCFLSRRNNDHVSSRNLSNLTRCTPLLDSSRCRILLHTRTSSSRAKNGVISLTTILVDGCSCFILPTSANISFATSWPLFSSMSFTPQLIRIHPKVFVRLWSRMRAMSCIVDVRSYTVPSFFQNRSGFKNFPLESIDTRSFTSLFRPS